MAREIAPWLTKRRNGVFGLVHGLSGPWEEPAACRVAGGIGAVEKDCRSVVRMRGSNHELSLEPFFAVADVLWPE